MSNVQKIMHVDTELNDSLAKLDVVLNTSNTILDIVFESSESGGGKLPYYTGDYTVDPKSVEQTLETKNKSMSDDITINPIYYSQTINPSGGYTVYIGME